MSHAATAAVLATAAAAKILSRRIPPRRQEEGLQDQEEAQEDTDSEGDLAGFVVGDDVVEYDGERPRKGKTTSSGKGRVTSQRGSSAPSAMLQPAPPEAASSSGARKLKLKGKRTSSASSSAAEDALRQLPWQPRR